jgi:dihydrofolate reductase
MRKLKLQMDTTIDGFVAGPENQIAGLEGSLDWMTAATDERLLAFIHQLLDTSATILWGRKSAADSVKYWEHEATQTANPQYSLTLKMVNTPKVVFSKTNTHVEGQNVRVENGPVVEAVKGLKAQAGRDIIVYGGATFVASLVEGGLIDEFNFLVNPVAIGQGMRIFSARTPLKLEASTAYANGVVVNTYLPE